MKLSKLLASFVNWGQRKYSPKSMEIYSMHIERFVDFFQDKNIEEVTLEEMMRFMDYLEHQLKLKGNTINLAMISIKQFWKMSAALEYQLGIRLPFTADLIPIKYHILAKSHRPLKEKDFKILITTVKTSIGQDSFVRLRDEAIFRVLWDTGLRISELTSLTLEAVDLDRNSLHVITRKRKDAQKFREVYLTKETVAILKRYLSERTSRTSTEALFIHWRKSSSEEREAITPRSVQRSMRDYCGKAGMSAHTYTPHSFRHSVGMRAAESQMFMPYIQAYLGHRNPASSQVYLNIQNEALRKEYHSKMGDSKIKQAYEQLTSPYLRPLAA